MTPIDWSREWLTSLLWVVKVYGAVLVGFALGCWLLLRRTEWGRQFWRISGMYFRPYGRSWRSWRPLLTVALLLLLTVIGVRLDVVLSNANNSIYTALQQLDADTFWKFVGVFAVIAVINIVLVLLAFYIGQAQIIQWRQWLNQRMVGDWLGGAAYHRGRYLAEPIDNPDQRIQQDITSFASTSQGLALGVVSSMVTLVSFTVILWSLSGPLDVAGVTVPRALVFTAYIYVIIATVVAFRIGRPLIKLNFLNERLTASYRYALVRVRENSENIAFYGGERVENAGLLMRFGAVITNTWAIVFRSMKFQGFNLIVNQIAVIFPIALQFPRYFSQQITLGDLTQSSSAFAQVQSALSFFRFAYDDFAGYKAVLIRLTGLLDANEQSRALPKPTVEEATGGLAIRDLDVRLPDGRPLLSDLELTVPAGTSLLVRGPSGSGKTTLLRSLAGLWPHVDGTIVRPAEDRVLFCSQQPYLPLGPLRDALSYPEPADTIDPAAAAAALQSVQLGHLVDRLDAETDWARTLSPGEQQRLAFGRILLARPSLVFLDESSSALDEGMEHSLYQLVRDRLPDCAIVSVGHRSTLRGLHDAELVLSGEGRWARSAEPA